MSLVACAVAARVQPPKRTTTTQEKIHERTMACGQVPPVIVYVTVRDVEATTPATAVASSW